MTAGWDGKAKPPEGPSDVFLSWLAEDIAAFQRAHPAVPQDPVQSLTARRRNELMRAYGEARNEASLEDIKRSSPEFYNMMKNAYRTGKIKIKAKRPQKAKRD